MPTIEEFGKTIKQKYPQYQNIDDKELALKMIEKYPQYKDRVFDTDPQSQQQIAGDKPTEGMWDAVKKGWTNVKQSIKQSGEEVADTLATPTSSPAGQFIKTAKVAGTLATGIAQPLIAEPIATGMRVAGEAVQGITGYDVNEATSQGVQKLVKAGMETETAHKLMTGWENIKQKDPESAMALSAVGDIAELLSYAIGGKVAKKGASETLAVAKKTGNAVSNVASGTVKGAVNTASKGGNYMTAQAYGFSPETVKTIIKNPELFTAREMAKIDRDSIFTKVKTAVSKRMDDLSATGKEYDAIKQLPSKANVSEDTITGLLKSKGIDVVDGKINVNLASDIQLSKSDITGLQEVLQTVSGKKSLTAKEVLNLRTRLSNLSAFGEGKTNASKLVAKEIRAKVDAIAKNEIPGLAELDAKFAPERQFLTKVKKEIFNADGSIKDNAVSKIATLTNKGKEMALKRIEKIIPGITEDVNILKAIEDVQHAGGQKVGTYMRTGLGAGGGMLAGGPVGAILGAIITSPQVGVSLLRTYAKAKGIASNAISGIVNKMKAGTKLIGKEKKLMDEAVDNAAQKLANRTKNIKPGMTIEDVSGNVKGASNINKIPEDDLREMSDFTDYVAGEYKPKSNEAQALELAASRIAEKYGIKQFKSTKGLSNAFSKILEKLNFKR